MKKTVRHGTSHESLCAKCPKGLSPVLRYDPVAGEFFRGCEDVHARRMTMIDLDGQLREKIRMAVGEEMMEEIFLRCGIGREPPVVDFPPSILVHEEEVPSAPGTAEGPRYFCWLPECGWLEGEKKGGGLWLEFRNAVDGPMRGRLDGQLPDVPRRECPFFFEHELVESLNGRSRDEG